MAVVRRDVAGAALAALLFIAVVAVIAVIGVSASRTDRVAQRSRDLEQRIDNACRQQRAVFELVVLRQSEAAPDALAHAAPMVWLCTGDWPTGSIEAVIQSLNARRSP